MRSEPSTLEIRRTFKCSKRELFDAWSKPGIMSRWFFADSNRCRDSEVEVDFRVNGGYALTMFFEDGDSAHIHGVYKEISRYSFIAFSWNSMHSTDSLVELQFRELSPNRTELKLCHKLLPDEASRDLHGHGWTMCLANLTTFIEAAASEG